MGIMKMLVLYVHSVSTMHMLRVRRDLHLNTLYYRYRNAAIYIIYT